MAGPLRRSNHMTGRLDRRLTPIRSNFHWVAMISITPTARPNRPAKLYRPDPSDLPLRGHFGPSRPPSGATFGPKWFQLGRPDPSNPQKNYVFLMIFIHFVKSIIWSKSRPSVPKMAENDLRAAPKTSKRLPNRPKRVPDGPQRSLGASILPSFWFLFHTF